MPGFDPLNLSPSASLNRVRIIDLPAVPLPNFVRGNIAQDLLSSATVAARVRQAAPTLGLSHADQLPDAPLLQLFDNCFESPNPEIRQAATRLAKEFGQALASLVATLCRGDTVNRIARSEWDGDVWAHWATVQRVVLGGGLVSGHFGDLAVQIAQTCLPKLGVPTVRLKRAVYAMSLPLIGAARSVPQHLERGTVFDFGHSFVKRAGATFRDGALTHLSILPPVPVTGEASLDTAMSARKLAKGISATIAATLREVGKPNGVTPTVVASVAGYFRDGHPLPEARGHYAVLRHLAPNAAQAIAHMVSAELGQEVEVIFVHDGSCAARAFAGESGTAIIMLGTALGVGFAPILPARPLAPTFTFNHRF
jgi:hypothetical protein